MNDARAEFAESNTTFTNTARCTACDRSLRKQRTHDVVYVDRTYRARDLDTIPQQNQRRPQLDPKRTPERPPWSIFDLVVHELLVCIGIARRYRLRQWRLRGDTMRTPRRAEFDQDIACEAIDRFARRLFDGVLVLKRHLYSPQ
jgi:hypothetical protein